MSKIKTYVLMVSRTFPATHPRKGEQTFFTEKINESLIPVSELPILGKKLHTIRANYELWEKRIIAVQEGKAVLSIRYWSGSPYNFKKDGSKQIELTRLDKDSGVGIQKIEKGIFFDFAIELKNLIIELPDKQIAINDGLSLDDFKAWFRGYDLSKPMAIIHFTKFRYQ